MKLNFVGNMEELNKGIEVLKDDYHFEVGQDGLCVRVEQKSGPVIHVSRSKNEALFILKKFTFLEPWVYFWKNLMRKTNLILLKNLNLL